MIVLELIFREPYRLPLESEWEHAYRAGETGYFWKDEQLSPLRDLFFRCREVK